MKKGENNMKQLNEKEAIKLYKSKIWEKWNKKKRAYFQMNQKRLCMPFDIFHEAVEYALDRPVFTHEFGLNHQGLIDEMNGKISKPTLEESINLIPEEKKLILIYNKE
jgi:hypothetical protein